MRRRFAGMLACGAASLLAGCVHSSTLVKLNPDGSGTIEQTITMAKESIERLTALAATEADKKSDVAHTLKELFSVEKAKAAAATMGPAVSFVSASSVNTPARTGLKAVYAFKDVRTLTLTALPSSLGFDGGQSPDMLTSPAFTRLPNGHALLTIQTDDTVADLMAAKPGAGNPARSSGGGLGDQAEAMLTTLLAGLKVDLAVQVGRVIKTNIPYVAGSTVTLIAVDFDQVLANRAAFDELAKAETPAEIKAALRGVKGIKINVEPELTIEFTK